MSSVFVCVYSIIVIFAINLYVAKCNLVINIIVNWLPSIFSLVVILGSQCPKYCKISLCVSTYVLFMD
jgi:hypothetical protein